MDDGPRRVVLDLGAASTSLLDFLGRARCRVEVADIAYFGGIERLNAASIEGDSASAADSLFPSRLTDDALDLVFCWDLLNYLSLESLAALIKAIKRRARPGAQIHALIYYADQDMRQQPGRIVPTEDADLIDRAAPSTRVPAPRYSPEELRKQTGYFEIDRVRLLSNGLQEFLFQLET